MVKKIGIEFIAWIKMKKTPIVLGVCLVAISLFIKYIFIAGTYFHRAMDMGTNGINEYSGVANLLVFGSCLYFLVHSVKTPNKKIVKVLVHKH